MLLEWCAFVRQPDWWQMACEVREQLEPLHLQDVWLSPLRDMAVTRLLVVVVVEHTLFTPWCHL